jgi:antitoxin component YwqK of YwqJK toxin-antitoxin module
MKNLLFTLALIFNALFQVNAQKYSDQILEQALSKWVYTSDGNPIDGSTREAFIIFIDTQAGVSGSLKVVNKAETIKIKNSLGEGDNDRDDIFINLRSSFDNNNIDEILMYFNNQNNYYKVNFKSFDNRGILFVNALSNNNSDLVTKFELIDLLKIKKEIFFRYRFSDREDINISFPLSGSSSAINKVVDISNITYGGAADATDMIGGIYSLKTSVNELEKSGDLSKLYIKRADLWDKLTEYLFEKSGGYLFAFTSFKYKGNLKLDILDLNNKLLNTIDLNQFKNKQLEKKITYYESGEVEAKAYFVDGKLQGEQFRYFKNGEVKAKANYIDGQQKGELIKYYESGEVKAKANYIDGQQQGELIKYYESGEVEAKAYFVDGKLQGEQFRYFKNGEVKAKANYIDGKIQGEAIIYSVNGEIEGIENYKDGVLINNKN